MKTLNQLAAEFDIGGFVIRTKGSGSSGPTWVPWSAEMSAEYGDIELFSVTDEDAGEVGDLVAFIELFSRPEEDVPKEEPFAMSADVSPEWISDWIATGNESGSFQYRILV